MADSLLGNIYRQNDKLEEQLPLWRFMKNKEQHDFIEEVEDLIVTAQQLEQTIKSRTTKDQLRKIIEIWNDFLRYTKNSTSSGLTALSPVRKTSTASNVTRAVEYSTIRPVPDERIRFARSLSQPYSTHKVDSNSSPSIPRNPKLRAIIDNFFGIVDSEGDTE